MRRAQGAMEFTIIATIGFLFFSSAIAVAEYQFLQIGDAAFEDSAEGLFNSVLEEVRIASQAGDGYARNITLPSTFDGLEYCFEAYNNTVSTARDELVLTVGETTFFRFLPEQLYMTHRFGPGLVNVKNIRGRVLLNSTQQCTRIQI